MTSMIGFGFRFGLAGAAAEPAAERDPGSIAGAPPGSPFRPSAVGASPDELMAPWSSGRAARAQAEVTGIAASSIYWGHGPTRRARPALVAARAHRPDALGAAGALAAPGAVRARGADDRGRRRPGPRSRDRAGRRATPPHLAWSRGERPLAARAGAGGAGGAGRLALHRAQLSLLRARSGADLAAAPQPSAPALSLGRDRRPRFRGAHARRPRARGAALRGRVLAGRQRAAQVAGRGGRGERDSRRRHPLGPLRSGGGVAPSGAAGGAPLH